MSNEQLGLLERQVVVTWRRDRSWKRENEESFP